MKSRYFYIPAATITSLLVIWFFQDNITDWFNGKGGKPSSPDASSQPSVTNDLIDLQGKSSVVTTSNVSTEITPVGSSNTNPSTNHSILSSTITNNNSKNILEVIRDYSKKNLQLI